jgi:stage III sporulation protein AA
VDKPFERSGNMDKKLIGYLPDEVKKIIRRTLSWLTDEIIEIRLRVDQPLEVITYNNRYFLNKRGYPMGDYNNKKKSFYIGSKILKKAILILTEHSLYALERQLKEGFITIEGGHRVGFTGEVVTEAGSIKRIRNINSINYRITREVTGAADKVVGKLYNFKNNIVYNTLIISPPLCGKTTLLRELIRVLSEGISSLGIEGKKLGVVDERSEIGGSYNGVPQNRIGYRTDLLDNCPKSEGMLILVRSMSPEVIAVDEIGDERDVESILHTLNAGVSLITTVHGESLDQVQQRPGLKKLFTNRSFQRYIILSKKKGDRDY